MKKHLFFSLMLFLTLFNAMAQDNTPEEAMISAEDILFWVGRGEQQTIFVVNWCAPEIAFAWGVRFHETTTTLAAVMDSVKFYDPRFDFAAAGGFLNNITYNDEQYSLTLADELNYWGFNVNGIAGMNLYIEEPISDGDFVKWGDQTCCEVTAYEEWGGISYPVAFVWTTEVTPVAPFQLFDGIVGSDGCQAIHFADPAILGWATGCTIQRGFQDITIRDLVASFGEEADATGVAILTFDMPIVDGEGYDFAVFENALNHTFLELAFVEVSSDGERFVRFPATSWTQTTTQIGNGGEVDATRINNLAGKYTVGWGTPFDLAELADSAGLDIHNITHVKLVDVIGTIDPQFGSRDARGNIINDPYPTPFYSSGFDLSGVAILNGWSPTSITEDNYRASISVYPNPATDVVNVQTDGFQTLEILNFLGQVVYSNNVTSSEMRINVSHLHAGTYFVRLRGDSNVATQKVVIY